MPCKQDCYDQRQYHQQRHTHSEEPKCVACCQTKRFVCKYRPVVLYQEKADALKTLGTTEQALSDYTVDVYGKTADVQLSFDAYRGDETSAGKLNYAELTVPCTPNGDGFSYMRTCYNKLEKALGEPFTTDVNMDGVSAEDDTDTLFAALQKDAGGENVCALRGIPSVSLRYAYGR